MKTAIILVNSLSSSPLPDEQDVMDQADYVGKALSACGYIVKIIYFDLNLAKVLEQLNDIKPEIVFNLVETVGGRGELIYLAPALLESFNFPFTGSSSYAIYATSNKVLAKKRLNEISVETPEWYNHEKQPDLLPASRYIIKPLWEDGSLGITDSSVIFSDQISKANLQSILKDKKVFIEGYIHGREFNISILGGKKDPVVLPVAEIEFIDYPAEKPHILNYASKWEPDSFEFHNSVRTFKFENKDQGLIESLNEISLRCWEGFGLNAYARVDFRVDENGKPYVLEVNANPCLSPDAGFMAAAKEGGLDSLTVVKRIMEVVIQ